MSFDRKPYLVVRAFAVLLGHRIDFPQVAVVVSSDADPERLKDWVSTTLLTCFNPGVRPDVRFTADGFAFFDTLDPAYTQEEAYCDDLQVGDVFWFRSSGPVDAKEVEYLNRFGAWKVTLIGRLLHCETAHSPNTTSHFCEMDQAVTKLNPMPPFAPA